jgi:hypothetical protein
MIPEGYTYLKPSDLAPFGLVAVRDADGATSTVISVQVSRVEKGLEQDIESMKALLKEKNASTKFSENLYSGTRTVDTRRVKLYRTTMSSRRGNGIATRALMVFFENDGKLYLLTAGSREEVFEQNSATYERVVSSFGPS